MSWPPLLPSSQKSSAKAMVKMTSLTITGWTHHTHILQKACRRPDSVLTLMMIHEILIFLDVQTSVQRSYSQVEFIRFLVKEKYQPFSTDGGLVDHVIAVDGIWVVSCSFIPTKEKMKEKWVLALLVLVRIGFSFSLRWDKTTNRY
uniref:Uncharacterized protein n=1 Tax=Opuntia streptacantha TaxID=393608 RepID=A0A7C8ZVG8_OPUST